ncbi:hypothetical protein PVA38_10355 [Streptococcus pneumoniae D39]|nr:hypothetical protein PVA38_10355 [Streptococcus pneumoniae D39]
MRGFNNKIKSVYQELTNSKEKFGSFHKTLIHLHTPVSYDYKLFSNWTATKYRNCLLYTSDAADEARSVDLGGRRIIKKKKKEKKSYDKIAQCNQDRQNGIYMCRSCEY